MTEFQKYIQRYVDLLAGQDLLQGLKQSAIQTLEIYSRLNDQTSAFSYAEGKWSLKDVLQHLTDAERIFVYRSLRFARQDATILAGWDEEAYGKTSDANQRSLQSIIEEFDTTRKSTQLFYENLNREQLSSRGVANGNEISVETIAKLVAGHNLHHLNIIRERYLPHL